MMSVPFTKASACGNDFLIIDAHHAPADMNEFTRRICDRHHGIGADGVEWLLPASDADAAIRLINADGSEAEISGNGTRCVAAYLVANGAKSKLAIRTGAGIKQCELLSSTDSSFDFEMNMGSATVGKPFELKISGREVTGTPVSMGNPHYVVFVDEFPLNWQAEAAEIQRQPNFKESVNVEYVRVAGINHIEVCFFERGAGETQSSGTGSCASASASIVAGRVVSPVTVHAEGGAQTVRWSGESIFLRGPAQIICRGEYFAGDLRG